MARHDCTTIVRTLPETIVLHAPPETWNFESDADSLAASSNRLAWSADSDLCSAYLAGTRTVLDREPESESLEPWTVSDWIARVHAAMRESGRHNAL